MPPNAVSLTEIDINGEEKPMTTNNTSLIPYRSPSPIEPYHEPIRPKHGLLIVPVAPKQPIVKVVPIAKQHQCDLPKPSFAPVAIVMRLIMGVPPLKAGDLWRCSDPHCGKVYRLWNSSRGGMIPFPIEERDSNKVRGCYHNCDLYCDWWMHSSLTDWITAGGSE